jgi:hypothetical protein
MVRKGGKPNQHALVSKRGHLVTYCLSRLRGHRRADRGANFVQRATRGFRNVGKIFINIFRRSDDFSGGFASSGLRRFHNATLHKTSLSFQNAGRGLGELAAGPVGRKTRRAQDVANCLPDPAPVLSRAVGVASPSDILNARFVAALDCGSFRRATMANARNGSKPARISIPEQ